MKPLEWSSEKNERLKKERGIGFEEVAALIIRKKVLKIVKNKSKERANQEVFLVNIHEYIYMIPFVEDTEKIFLKTIIPSRKATKEYLVKK